MPKRIMQGIVVGDKADKTVTVSVERRIMFEIDGVSWDLAQQALTLAAAKLPLDTRIVRRLGDSD